MRPVGVDTLGTAFGGELHVSGPRCIPDARSAYRSVRSGRREPIETEEEVAAG